MSMDNMNVDDDDDAGEMLPSYGDGRSWIRGQFLGKGSFGAVFLATSKLPWSVCLRPIVMAVKSAEILNSKTLKHERTVLRSLTGCQNVIQCFGSEITHRRDGSPVYNLLLEHASGGTLRDRIRSSGGRGLPELEARRYAGSIIKGLVKIHQAGYVHCDVKPENILLVSENHQIKNGEEKFIAKICDFGEAKTVKEDSQKLNLKRFCNGTPWYLAPESVRKGLQEPPADIWSLGITVLEMLTGRCAWGLEKYSGDRIESVLRKLYYKSSSLPNIPEDLSPQARSFLKLCLRRVAKNRATAKSLLQHPFINGYQDDGSSDVGSKGSHSICID